MPHTETQNVWVLVYRAPDLPGQWMAHCLDLDIVSQGNSLEHAFQMSIEAVLMCVADDIQNGLDPFARDEAPEEAWEPFYRLMKNHVPLASVPTEQRDKVKIVAAQVQLHVNLKAEAMQSPEPWMLASVESRRSSLHC